jgi:hypothetical protein
MNINCFKLIAQKLWRVTKREYTRRTMRGLNDSRSHKVSMKYIFWRWKTHFKCRNGSFLCNDRYVMTDSIILLKIKLFSEKPKGCSKELFRWTIFIRSSMFGYQETVCRLWKQKGSSYSFYYTHMQIFCKCLVQENSTIWSSWHSISHMYQIKKILRTLKIIVI